MSRPGGQMVKFNKKTAYAAIVALGIVSLLGDVIYEGSRSVVPEYLGFLGASALLVSTVGGLGEFIGYAFRFVSGVLADTTRSYWVFTILGYGMIIAIPLLAISGSWPVAALLVVVERLGKAIRSPARDVILSDVSRGIGTGKAFGIHEFLDQIGAVLGPILVILVMVSTGNSYSIVFAFLSIPFIIMLLALFFTYKKVKKIQDSVRTKFSDQDRRKGLSKKFYMYIGAVSLNSIGLIPVWLILFKGATIVTAASMQWVVPAIYLVVQAVDAPSALISGHAYDKIGVSVLLLPFFVSIFPAILLFAAQDVATLVISAVLFGIVLGMQESIYRAAVADLAPMASRGKAYGIFYTMYGLGFLISGVVYGAFFNYGVSILVISIYAILVQTVALLALLKVKAGAER